MCGIAGIIRFDGAQADVRQIQSMMNIMKHRGPDDEGIYVKESFGLGHVRLSIIDLSSAGHQPMFSNDNRYVIVFNGEIYNYLELKSELTGKYDFKTRSDTEVILAAYHEWGASCLNRFNGDWAFIIYDHVKNEFFGARDRYGIKPFYYHIDQEQLVFASEIKAIVPFMKVRKPNEKLIFEYLIYNRTDQYLETFFEGVCKLKHGHFFYVRDNRFTIHQWYTLREKIGHHEMSINDYREELRNTLKLRLRSDVPVGISLSGGIDSSTTTSIIINDFNLRDIKTFSSVYGKNVWADETDYIDEYRNQLKNMFYTYPTAEIFYNDLKKFIRCHYEPVANVGPYGQFKVMELAKGNVVVTLDGQGADEMLAGYHNFFGAYFKELITTLSIPLFMRESIAYLKKHKSFHAFNYMAFYSLPTKYKKFIGTKLYGSVNGDFYNRMRKSITISDDLYNPVSLNDSLLQHFEFKLEHLLKWDDLNSLNFSIESRVPFLDHNLVEKTISLPAHLKIKNAVTKYILRESVRDVLPSKIYNRQDKKGFTIPSNEWFKTKLFRNLIMDILHSKSFNNRGYFNVNDCVNKYQNHIEGKINCSKDIWKWINLEFWFQEFIDKTN